MSKACFQSLIKLLKLWWCNWFVSEYLDFLVSPVNQTEIDIIKKRHLIMFALIYFETKLRLQYFAIQQIQTNSFNQYFFQFKKSLCGLFIVKILYIWIFAAIFSWIGKSQIKVAQNELFGSKYNAFFAN